MSPFKLSMYEEFKTAVPCFYSIQTEIQLQRNWGDYQTCIFELKPMLNSNRSLLVSSLFRSFLALLTAVMNTNTWSVEEQ